MNARPRSTTIAVPSLHVQIQRYSTQLLLYINTNIYYILVIIYKYKDALHTYYYLQIQRYIKYLSFFTNTKIYYILFIFFKYKDTAYTYYHLQIQRYSSLLLLCKYTKVLYILSCTNTKVRTYLLSCTNTKVQYILIIMYKYKCIVHTYNYVQIQRYSSYLLFRKVYVFFIITLQYKFTQTKTLYIISSVCYFL